MLRAHSKEDELVTRLVGKGSRKGKTAFGRFGTAMQRPPSWALAAGVLSAAGTQGRRAALRGCVCYLSASAAHLPLKLLVGRRHPPGSALLQLGPFTSSFPSGHAAADLAFVFGAAQELPKAFLPLSVCTLSVHWALIRKRAHYPTDVLAGGALGIGTALVVRKIWPPSGRNLDVDAGPPPQHGSD